VECTPFAYGQLFPGVENMTTAFLRAATAPG
jgi:hypothetical protein